MSTETLPTSDDPYELLGVGHDADEKEIKKKYFALMRKFPPETHPDEFNRIQHAYETLKDPAARAALSEKPPYEDVPEPYRTRLREVLTQLDEGNSDLARTQLATLVTERPDLVDARDLYHRVLFAREQYQEAEAQLVELIRQKPDDPWFRYRHSVTLTRLGADEAAVGEAEAWLRLTEGKEPAAWMLVAEALATKGNYPAAFAKLDEGLTRFPAPSLLLTRIHLLIRAHKASQVGGELDRLGKALDGAKPDEREEASERLHSLAAMCFDRKETDVANRLLRIARELVGAKEAIQFPDRVESWIDELPETSRRWLEAESKDPHFFNIKRLGRTWDVVFLVSAAAVLGAVIVFGLAAEGWSPRKIVAYGVLVSAVAALFAFTWRRTSGSFGARHVRMTSVHPLYMLEVGTDRLKAWPIVNLNDVKVVHQHTNGVYTASTVTLHFAKKKVNLAVRGQDLSVTFVQTLQGFRYRALQLMQGGLLEAEEGYDFIPIAHLDPKRRSPLHSVKTRAAVSAYGAALAAAMIVTGASAASNVRSEPSLRWANAVRGQALDAAPPLLADAPDEKSAALVKKLLEARIASAKAELLATAPSDELRARAGAVADAIGAAKAPVIELRWHATPLAPFTLSSVKPLAVAVDGALCGAARRMLQVTDKAIVGAVPLELTATPYARNEKARVGAATLPLFGVKLSAALGAVKVPELDVHLEEQDLEALRPTDEAHLAAAAEEAVLAKAGRALTYALGLSRHLTAD